MSSYYFEIESLIISSGNERYILHDHAYRAQIILKEGENFSKY